MWSSGSSSSSGICVPATFCGGRDLPNGSLRRTFFRRSAPRPRLNLSPNPSLKPKRSPSLSPRGGPRKGSLQQRRIRRPRQAGTRALSAAPLRTPPPPPAVRASAVRPRRLLPPNKRWSGAHRYAPQPLCGLADSRRQPKCVHAARLHRGRRCTPRPIQARAERLRVGLGAFHGPAQSSLSASPRWPVAHLHCIRMAACRF